MVDPAESVLAQQLAEALAPLGFASKDIGTDLASIPILGAWVRKTWNTNRAVVHLHAPPGQGDLGPLSQKLKVPLGKRLGYTRFFYGLGLQVVWSGPELLGRAESLKQGLDGIDNQACIVQSIFVVDLTQGCFRESRTWGQVITGKFQDAVARCLARTYRAEE